MDDQTALVNPYQLEHTQLDGNVRTVLVEQDLVDGVQKKKGNFFFPNDNALTLPSIPDGVWKFFTPFSGSVAIGKNSLEVFPSTTTKESDTISAISSSVDTLNGANTLIQKTTGQECIEGVAVGFCTPTATPDTEAQCSIDGGTWTPASPDVIQNKADLQAEMITLKAEVQNWETTLLAQKAAIQAADALDTNPTRTSENATAIADIDNALSIIDTWQALPDFYIGHGATDCTAFDALDPSTFPATKLATTDILSLTVEISARTIFSTTRAAQVSGYLGSVGQDLTTGVINGTGSGLYDARYKAINVRLNLLGGSLNKLSSVDRGQDAQTAQKATNAASAALYNSVMKVTLLRAPAANTGTIHVKSSADFSIGNAIFIVAEQQDELTGNISNIDGNTIFLDFNIPEKYTHENRSRLYKIL